MAAASRNAPRACPARTTHGGSRALLSRGPRRCGILRRAALALLALLRFSHSALSTHTFAMKARAAQGDLTLLPPRITLFRWGLCAGF